MPVSTVGGLARLEGDDILFANGSFLEPTQQFLFQAEALKTVKTPLNKVGAD